MINKKLKPLDIDIHVQSELWRGHTSCLRLSRLKKITRFILDSVALCKHAEAIELSLRLTSDAEIKIYNARYRSKNKPTNVLSFPTFDFGSTENPRAHLGDIMLAFETISKEAAAQRKTFADHATHLFAHSVLHLLGFNHEEKKDRERMENLEVEILRNFNIKSPYA